MQRTYKQTNKRSFFCIPLDTRKTKIHSYILKMQLLILLAISLVANFYQLAYALGDSSLRNDAPLDFCNGLQNQVRNIQQKLNDQEKKISEQKEKIKQLPKFCQGKTRYDQWLSHNAGSFGIMVYVNTTSCHFNQVPTYFTSLSGLSQHWTTLGITSIYGGTSTGFTVFLAPDIAREPKEYSMAQLAMRRWELNWIGIVHGE